jgi:D-alanyl-lipoteichoic acid acyltransferase DltB (MBOAT superfamily)
MLFNSYPFLLLFLPVTALGFFLLARAGHTLAAAWLAVASLFFYGWWNPAYLGLLVGSIAFNYVLGMWIAKAHARGRARDKDLLLVFAVTANLALLGYYKYANFFVQTVDSIAGTAFGVADIVLPLGISFFTFTQIAFLVDAHRGEAREYSFVHYVLFVTYFPHLIAGPILHHKEMMPQFGHASIYRPQAENFAVGITIFAIGLVKKTVLADNVAPFVAPVFDAAAAGSSPTLLEAWGGALAYTCQLYFDFSGYSDMAIGLSRMFGVQLPLNFDSPYKALSISDFWRRWHMTLSRFLRDYLYIALGGNRRGATRRHVNLFLTMLLGGLWHGAGWTFVVWGALHGVYLIVNHAWRELVDRLGLDRQQRAYRLFAFLCTFLAVVVGWVFFRATSFGAALRILEGMVGMNGVAIPAAIGNAFGPLSVVLLEADVRFTLGGGGTFVRNWLWVGALLAIALLAPNTQQIVARYRPGLDAARPGSRPGARWLWQPTTGWAVFVACLGAAGVLSLDRVSEFLYFQF